MAQMILYFKMPLLQFPQNSATRKDSRMLAKMIQAHKMLQSGLAHNPKFSQGPSMVTSTPVNRKQSILDITVSMKKNLESGHVAHVYDSRTLKTDSRGFPAQDILK